MRGEVYRLPARGKGHERQGRRYAVVLQPDWLTLSTWIVAFTSTSARKTTFRPDVEVAGNRTRVMCDQIATVDLNRLADRAGYLTLEEMQRVDETFPWCLICNARDGSMAPVTPPACARKRIPCDTALAYEGQSSDACLWALGNWDATDSSLDQHVCPD